MMRSNMLESIPGESEVDYWKRENKRKELDELGREKELKLYCQSSCYRFPGTCPYLKLLYPYDRSAETCPDFIPKDCYKPRSKAICLLKRLAIDPDFTILPDTEVIHPIYREAICDTEAYYKIMTKHKVYNQMEALSRV